MLLLFFGGASFKTFCLSKKQPLLVWLGRASPIFCLVLPPKQQTRLCYAEANAHPASRLCLLYLQELLVMRISVVIECSVTVYPGERRACGPSHANLSRPGRNPLELNTVGNQPLSRGCIGFLPHRGVVRVAPSTSCPGFFTLSLEYCISLQIPGQLSPGYLGDHLIP